MSNKQNLMQRGKRRQLSIIQTDLAEPEELIREIAEKTKEHDPKSFAGKDSCVFFRFRYVPPYDNFKELKYLILRVREATGLRADFQGVVALEASEWLGHEKEEYFTVMLKYLYDHANLWQCAMVLQDCTEAQLQRFASGCAAYITPQIVNLNLFSHREWLEQRIQAIFAENCARVSREGLRLLAETMMRKELREVRSVTLLERAAEEVMDLAGDCRDIDEGHVRSYLSDPCSALTMLAGKPLVEERSGKYEKESLRV